MSKLQRTTQTETISMDYLTAFVTIVQLLAVFSQERGSARATQKLDFLRWLEDHNHKQLKEFIESNQRLRDEIEALLKKQNSELILAKVSEINGVCSEILARIDIFSGMAATLPPTRILSAQAIDIIRIFYTAPGADQLVWVTGEEVLRLGHGATGITIDELALLGDDLDQLCRMGLLSEQGINVGPSFNQTRLGQAFVAKLPS
jgi:hypothetical protein